MRFLKSVELKPDCPEDGYPWDIPAVRNMEDLDFKAPVTFLVGDNGSGKSTLVEAIAIAAGFHPEGGTMNYAFEARPTTSPLAANIWMRWDVRPRSGWFLRSESFYNLASSIDDNLPEDFANSFHERSHGQSFIDLAMERFRGAGFYVLDEPEAALSLQGCLKMMSIMHDCVESGAQFIVATHSPVLMSFPGAKIFELDESGFAAKTYDEVDSVALWKSFLEDPQRFLRHLLHYE